MLAILATGRDYVRVRNSADANPFASRAGCNREKQYMYKQWYVPASCWNLLDKHGAEAPKPLMAVGVVELTCKWIFDCCRVMSES